MTTHQAPGSVQPGFADAHADSGHGVVAGHDVRGEVEARPFGERQGDEGLLDELAVTRD